MTIKQISAVDNYLFALTEAGGLYRSEVVRDGEGWIAIMVPNEQAPENVAQLAREFFKDVEGMNLQLSGQFWRRAEDLRKAIGVSSLVEQIERDGEIGTVNWAVRAMQGGMIVSTVGTTARWSMSSTLPKQVNEGGGPSGNVVWDLEIWREEMRGKYWGTVGRQ